jgi:6-phosphogluconolactonase
MSLFEKRLTILADPEALSIAVANWLFHLATDKKGIFTICLSGGSTPRRLYELLAVPPFRDAFPWSRTHLIWGDERFVPRDDPSSNYGMVRDALLAQIPILAQNVHSVPTEGLNAEAAATAYEQELKSFYGADRLDPARPIFDVTLLGLGPDGHTASLFPGSTVLTERDHWTAAVIGPKRDARITLTYPALESSRHAAFLIEGKEKRAIFERIREGDRSLPAACLSPVGELHVFGDIASVGERRAR